MRTGTLSCSRTSNRSTRRSRQTTVSPSGRSPSSTPPARKIIRMKTTVSPRCWVLVCFMLAIAAAPAGAQLNPDQAAEMLLNSARKAYNEKNFPFAIQRFKEFLGKHGGHKLVNDARYGLALADLEGPEMNFVEARDLLQGLANTKDFPEQP